MRHKEQSRNHKRTKILIADREAIYRLGLKKVFSVEDDLRVVAQAENALQVLAMGKSFEPDVMIVQQEISDEAPHQLLTQIHRESPRCRVIVTVSVVPDDGGRRFLQAGGAGFFRRSEQPEVFVKSTREASEGKAVLPEGKSNASDARMLSTQEHRSRPVDTLTRRERAIISYLTQGCKNREIAHQLSISEQTVKNHLRSIYDKVGVSDRLELVLYTIHQRLELPSMAYTL